MSSASEPAPLGGEDCPCGLGRPGGPVLEDLAPDALSQWQLRMLREAVAYAQDRSRFYGEKLRDIKPSSLASVSNLATLPFTWPSDLARDPLAFLCVPRSEVARVTTATTSGTSGTKKRIFFTAADLGRTVDFFARGMRSMASSGQRCLILMSGETENSVGRLLQTALSRIGVASTIAGAKWSTDEALEAARRADCIVGIPSQIAYLCRSDAGLRPRSVLLSADFVPRSVIRAIEAAWRCDVFTHYGMTETGFGCAVQCGSRDAHHLRDTELLVEIVDPESGSRVAPGDRGEIAVTTLCSEAMPLLRYRTGDIGSLLPRPCACGWTGPCLGRVEGRRENQLTLPGGGVMSIHQLDELMFEFEGLRGFEARLERLGDRERLFLVVDAQGQVDREALASGLAPGIDIDLRYAAVDPFVNRAKRRIELPDEG